MLGGAERDGAAGERDGEGVGVGNFAVDGAVERTGGVAGCRGGFVACVVGLGGERVSVGLVVGAECERGGEGWGGEKWVGEGRR